MSDFWHLVNVDWLAQLSGDERAKLEGAAILHRFSPGETVFAPEVHPHSVYLLCEGRVRIYRLSEGGSETTFGYVAPGEVFGELPAFGDHPRESFAEAVVPSVVWKVPLAVFQELLEGRPSLVFEVTKQIGQRLKRIESRVESLVFLDARTRLARILLELACDLGVSSDGDAVIDAELTQSELATLVGATRQTVNASLGELIHDGLVERDGKRLRIPNVERLRQSLQDRMRAAGG
jgi:CRP-like cAMP-binding protein